MREDTPRSISRFTKELTDVFHAMLVKIKSVSIRALRLEEEDRLLICKIASSTRSSNVIPCIFYSLSLLSSPFSSIFHSLLSFSSAFSSPSPPILRSPLFASSFPSPNDRTHKLVRYLGIILNIVDRTMAFQSRETRLTFTCNYLSRHAVPRNAITPQANRMPLSSGWKKKRVCVESKYRSISLGSNRNPRFLEVSFFLFFRTFVPHPPLTFTTRISFDSIRIYPDSRSFASINSV